MGDVPNLLECLPNQFDKVTNKTFELHARKITSYPGSFKQYVRLRDEKYERELKEFNAEFN